MKYDIRVLIVEDNEDYLYLINNILNSVDKNSKDYQFYTKTCKSYKEMKNLLDDKNINVDLVLLDLNLEDICWTSIIETFVRDFPNIPFCIMSALGSKSYSLYALENGAQDYFVKHDRRVNIKERLCQALARHKYYLSRRNK